MNTLTKPDSGRLRAGLAAAALLLAFALPGCGKSGAKDEHAGEGDKHAEHAGEKKEGKDGHSEAESELTLTSEEAARAGIKVEEVKPQALGETLTVTATIRPDADRLAHVAARIEGRITSVPAKLGDKVRAGQTLATLDSVAVGEAHAAWIEAQAELGIAEADFKRAESLNAEEIIPRKDYLRAKADRDKAAASLRAAADRLRLLGGSPNASGAGGLGLRRDRALCRHRHREEGHARRTGQPERTAVQRRRPEPGVDPGRPAGKRTGQGAHRCQRQGDGAGLSERGLRAAVSATSAPRSTRTRAPWLRASRWPMPTAG